MKMIVMGVLALVCALGIGLCDEIEKNARAKFEASGAADLNRAELIVLVHGYRQDFETEIIRGMDNKVHIAHLESAVRNLVNDIMGYQAQMAEARELIAQAQSARAELLALKAEDNQLRRRIEDRRRVLGSSSK